eukprot:scaffold4103_cov248-Ochromonas_danica.AAC.1
MKNYFTKVKGSAINFAKKSATLISNVVQSTTVSFSSEHSSHVRPEQEFENLFLLICKYLDQEANLYDADTTEADNRLQKAGVRGSLKKMIAMLENDDKMWLEAQRKLGYENIDYSDEEVKTPILDYLLQKHVIQQLCQRGMNDLPRGTMPLMLSTLSSLLRVIKYPLLPHQSVYKPISNLISVATRYDAVFTSSAGSDQERVASYKRRIKIGLCSLLRTLWRKVTENPPVLDLFIVSQRTRGVSTSRRPSWSLTPLAPKRVYFDLLSGLIPLLEEPKVSHYALESLLIALSLNDSRVTEYLVEETLFAHHLIRAIGDYYTQSIIELQAYFSSSAGFSFPYNNGDNQKSSNNYEYPDYFSILLPVQVGAGGLPAGLGSPLSKPTAQSAWSTTPQLSSHGPSRAQPINGVSGSIFSPNPLSSNPQSTQQPPTAVRNLVRCLAVLRAIASTLLGVVRRAELQSPSSSSSSTSSSRVATDSKSGSA